MKRFWLIFVVLVVALTATGCYINDDVQTHQVGIQLNRNAIVTVVSSGVYTNMGWFADLKVMDINTLTFSVDDPEVLTSDNQAVAVKITIQARRKADNDSVRNIFTNWSTLVDNDVLVATISATAREGIKIGTRTFTTTQLLDDRNGLALAIAEKLKEDTAKYSVDVINVTVENIAFDPKFTDVLNEKALLRVETEKELQRQQLIKQQASNDVLKASEQTLVIKGQIIQAKAQTELEVNVASREGQKIAELNKIYETNQYAFELEKLRLLEKILGDKSVFYIPENTSIYQFVGNLTNTLPTSTVPLVVPAQ